MYVTGNFGKLGFGRTGSLSSGAQSNHILTGWALGTGLGLSSWTSEIGTSPMPLEYIAWIVNPEKDGVA